MKNIDISSVFYNIKHDLNNIKNGYLDNICGWSGTIGCVDSILKSIDQLTDMISKSSKLSLRDQFAMAATSEDIESFKDMVPEEEREMVTDAGKRMIVTGIPITWRVTARYLFADAMLAAKEKV